MTSPAETVELPGTRASAVVEALLDRRERVRTGKGRDDGRKLGLVVEGGSLRGVYSGGAMLALDAMKLSGLFDEIHVTSAGAFNAAYMLAGQVPLGMSIYLEELCSRRFFSPLRWGKLVDIDYVVDTVVAKTKRLDVDAVLASPTKLHVQLLDCLTAESACLSPRGEEVPLLALLKAASALPVLYNRPVEIEGRPYFDAGICNPVPVEAALEAGCTHVLVLLTRKPGGGHAPPGAFVRFAFRHLVAHGGPKMERAFMRRHVVDAASRALAYGTTPAPNGACIATLHPDDGSVSRLTQDPAKLRPAAARMQRVTLDVFEGTDEEAAMSF